MIRQSTFAPPKRAGASRLASLALIAVLSHCRSHPTNGTPSSRSATPPVPAESSAPAPVPSAAPAAAPPGDVAASASGITELGFGTWADAAPYRFRVTRVERCPRARSAPASASAARLGFSVQILSKYDGLLVHPRDLHLEKNGVIHDSEPSGTGCGGPALTPIVAKHGQTVAGVVTFQLTTDADARSAKVVFEPTRWGGAPRVEVSVPECLDACAPGARRPSAR